MSQMTKKTQINVMVREYAIVKKLSTEYFPFFSIKKAIYKNKVTKLHRKKLFYGEKKSIALYSSVHTLCGRGRAKLKLGLG